MSKHNSPRSFQSFTCNHIFRFQGFVGSSKLSYVIIVNDGPIWAIKFHPSESPVEKRIGLLAVATANQSIFIYSLPYLNNDKSIVLSLEPYLVCKLEEDDVFFNEDYLLQVSKIAWFQKNDCDCVLAGGFISGLVGVWNISHYEDQKSKTLYPHHVIQAHLEPVTALDFKATTGPEFHLLTASFDRKLKVFTLDDTRCQETTSYYAESRVQCAEWWMHWPGYLIGFDDCFTFQRFIHRQPLEFGMRNSALLTMNSTIFRLNVNHWLNFVMFVTDAGDVIGFQPNQMLQNYAKNKWLYYNFSFCSSIDYNRIITDGVEETGIVFVDYKVRNQRHSLKIGY